NAEDARHADDAHDTTRWHRRHWPWPPGPAAGQVINQKATRCNEWPSRIRSCCQFVTGAPIWQPDARASRLRPHTGPSPELPAFPGDPPRCSRPIVVGTRVEYQPDVARPAGRKHQSKRARVRSKPMAKRARHRDKYHEEVGHESCAQSVRSVVE